jgi:hypothetical protein
MTPSVAVFSGHFASQPLVFAHLLDAADRHGLALDLDHVEVVQGDPAKRLAHVFAADVVARIQDARDGADTLVLVFAEALIPGARLFSKTSLLRPIGRFPAIRPRVAP